MRAGAPSTLPGCCMRRGAILSAPLRAIATISSADLHSLQLTSQVRSRCCVRAYLTCQQRHSIQCLSVPTASRPGTASTSVPPSMLGSRTMTACTRPAPSQPRRTSNSAARLLAPRDSVERQLHAPSRFVKAGERTKIHLLPARCAKGAVEIGVKQGLGDHYPRRRMLEQVVDARLFAAQLLAVVTIGNRSDALVPCGRKVGEQLESAVSVQ